MAEFLGAIHEMGRPDLYSLQPLYLLERQSVEQRISSVKSAGDKRICSVAPRSGSTRSLQYIVGEK